jgi:uncharacterized membrane protein
LEAYLLDWLNLLVRWAHVVVGIAWIGASFYFIWLDNHLEASPDPKLAGELWAIHGGGFYNARKYKVGPDQLPATLHWFKWEAYWTWITGFALLVLMYYVNAELYLIDPAVMALSKPAAIAIGLGVMVGGYAVYEGLCRSPLARNDLLLSGTILALLALAAWGLTKIFSGRGAFIRSWRRTSRTSSSRGSGAWSRRSRPGARPTRATARWASRGACTTPTSRCRCCW